MGSENTANAEKGIWRRALGCGLLMILAPTVLLAACPGPSCPAIAVGIAGGECPGAGCPAFASTMADQQSYLDLFGTLQSGGDAPRPVQGRLLLDIPFPEGEAALPGGNATFLRGTCDLLTNMGIHHVEVLGFPRGGPDALATRRAASLADDLDAVCADAECPDGFCPVATSRPASPSDELPADLTPVAGHTLIELRVVP